MAHDSGKFRALVAAVGGDFNAGGAAFTVCTEYLGGWVFAAQFGQGGRVCLAGALAGEAFVDVADTGFGADFAFSYIRAGGHESLPAEYSTTPRAAVCRYRPGGGQGGA